MNATETYRPSGRVEWRKLARCLAFALPGAVVAGWCYQYLLHWFAHVVVAVLAPIGFGLLLGLAGAAITERSECRNRLVAVLLGLALALSMLAASHWADYRIGLGRIASDPHLRNAFRQGPPSYGKYVSFRVEQGFALAKKHSTETWSGPLVWFVWLVEAGFVLWFAVRMTTDEATRPYCEYCHSWMSMRLHEARLGFDEQALTAAVQAGSIGALLAVEGGAAESLRKLELTVHGCDQCGRQHFLSATVHRLAEKSEGKQGQESETLVRHALMAPDQVERLARTASSPEELVRESAVLARLQRRVAEI